MNFLNSAFRIGRVFGITIRVHVLFLLWIGYTLFTTESPLHLELLFLGMLFGIVLVHEFGHCFGARAVGGYAHDILMWPLGGLAFAQARMEPWPQFVTVASGPLVNVIFCLGSAGVLIGSTGHLGIVSLNPFARPVFAYFSAPWQIYLWQFYWLNLMLFCFNMLPVFPFDGGQLFRAIIWPFVGLHRATILAAQLGLVGAIALGLFGAMNKQYMLIAIAFFGGSTSLQHLQAARAGLANQEFLGADYILREKRGTRGLWSRLFGSRRRRVDARPVQRMNPNPGGWAAKQAERDRENAELDRILKKVSESGVQSLSYVERQTLERITRERRAEENQYQSENRL